MTDAVLVQTMPFFSVLPFSLFTVVTYFFVRMFFYFGQRSALVRVGSSQVLSARAVPFVVFAPVPSILCLFVQFYQYIYYHVCNRTVGGLEISHLFIFSLTDLKSGH